MEEALLGVQQVVEDGDVVFRPEEVLGQEALAQDGAEIARTAGHEDLRHAYGIICSAGTGEWAAGAARLQGFALSVTGPADLRGRPRG